MFNQRLDFLMELTKTSNSALGQAIGFTPSHISRLRTGARKLPQNPSFLSSMAQYFSKKIQTNQQKDILSNILGESLPASNEALSKILLSWFLSQTEKKYHSGKVLCKETTLITTSSASTEYYFGLLGKAQAFMRLIDEITLCPTPQTLYVYCDEPFLWLNEIYPGFPVWNDIITLLINKGHKICIIHTLNRDVSEITFAITKWLPLYCSGAIKSYYYPWLRDKLFQFLLFFSPKVGAVTCTSIHALSKNHLNLYHTDPQALRILNQEFNGIISLCRPLFKKCTKKSLPHNPIWALSSSTVSLSVSMPYLSLPSFFPVPWDIEYWLGKGTQIIEVFTLPSTDEIKGGKVPIPFALVTGDIQYYTLETLLTHLQYINYLSEKYPNYFFSLSTQNKEYSWLLLKEKAGGLLFREIEPLTAMSMEEQALIDIVWAYASSLYDISPVARQKNTNILQKHISFLEKECSQLSL